MTGLMPKTFVIQLSAPVILEYQNEKFFCRCAPEFLVFPFKSRNKTDTKTFLEVPMSTTLKILLSLNI
uniref:Uncharacterized protein n=1 Tax=Romanomermis culicivorax TaxID=13658 RepID=A0A915K6F0_ROMCU